MDEGRQDFQQVAELMEKHMSITMADFLPLIGHVANDFQEMASLFDIDVGDTGRLQSMREFASLSLLPVPN